MRNILGIAMVWCIEGLSSSVRVAAVVFAGLLAGVTSADGSPVIEFGNLSAAATGRPDMSAIFESLSLDVSASHLSGHALPVSIVDVGNVPIGDVLDPTAGHPGDPFNSSIVGHQSLGWSFDLVFNGNAVVSSSFAIYGSVNNPSRGFVGDGLLLKGNITNFYLTDTKDAAVGMEVWRMLFQVTITGGDLQNKFGNTLISNINTGVIVQTSDTVATSFSIDLSNSNAVADNYAVAVPLPSASLMGGVGLAGLAALRRRMRK
ncbi:MAG: VPLPA-CTERM sorting domain-containing protein [Tepidisphaeraceae bacterium]|jgi:hypothetical protein